MHLLLVLAACGLFAPKLDVADALEGTCDTDGVFVVGHERLAVFEGPTPRLAVNLVLDRDWVVDGEWTEPEGLSALLEEKVLTAKDLGARTGSPEYAFKGDLLLQVSVETPASDIVSALSSAESAGFHHIHFVGRSAVERPVAPYADPDFAKAIDEANAKDPLLSNKAYDEVTDGVIESCPPLEAAFEELGQDRPDDACAAFIDAIVTSLPKCPDADHRKIVTLIQHNPTRGAPVLTTLSTRLAADAPAFEVHADETWEAIVPRLQAAGPTTRWVLR